MWGTRKQKADQSWGELHPQRVCEWLEEEQQVALLVPRFGRSRVGRTLERWTRASPYRVHLDEIGTFVWRRCDGQTRVSDIAGAMQEEFGDEIEPVEERLVQFLQQLLRGRFVSMYRSQMAAH
ncbi:PqqD family protein [Myxococcota bacterium]